MYRLNKVTYTLLFTFLMVFSRVNAQDTTKVKIIEEKTKKRVNLFAENITESNHDVFFMVNATGFRRSASRPMIKTIPAKTKVHLITLIPLANVESKYDYRLIVQDKTTNIGIRKDHEPIKLKLPDKLLVFTRKQHAKSQEFINALKDAKISFEEVDFDTASVHRELLNNHFIAKNVNRDSVELPVVSFKRDIHLEIKTVEALKRLLQ
ncbi:hypothetical protein ABN763_11660 [Spongiivirga sp. MCCC 1A20706]|uniref:hypothetical protein n=1 Tax=Spongiivirga sp. MCCC 1A20706 TaxID=3160963 RepID=UPI00397753CF